MSIDLLSAHHNRNGVPYPPSLKTLSQHAQAQRTPTRAQNQCQDMPFQDSSAPSFSDDASDDDLLPVANKKPKPTTRYLTNYDHH